MSAENESVRELERLVWRWANGDEQNYNTWIQELSKHGIYDMEKLFQQAQSDDPQWEHFLYNSIQGSGLGIQLRLWRNELGKLESIRQKGLIQSEERFDGTQQSHEAVKRKHEPEESSTDDLKYLVWGW